MISNLPDTRVENDLLVVLWPIKEHSISFLMHAAL